MKSYFLTILVCFPLITGCASLSALLEEDNSDRLAESLAADEFPTDRPSWDNRDRFIADQKNDNQHESPPGGDTPRIIIRKSRTDSAYADVRPISRGIRLGMSMEDVRALWGHPADIEVAGNPRFGNQKWIYSDGFSENYGIGRAKIVYFEQGKVAGWDTTAN